MTSTQVFRLVLVAHLLAGIAAFGPLLVMPLVARRSLGADFGPVGRAAVADTSLWVRRWISEPAFVAVGLLGTLVAVLHPDDRAFSHLWVQLAIAFWLIAVAVVVFVQGPLARRARRLAVELANGIGGAEQGAELARVSRFLELLTTISAVGLPVMLSLMVFQPQ